MTKAIKLSIKSLLLIAITMLAGCNLFRTQYTIDETSNYPEIINADYKLAQDCIIFKVVTKNTDFNAEQNYICLKDEWKVTKKYYGSDNKIEIVKNIPRGTPCNVSKIHASYSRIDDHMWIPLYSLTLNISGYIVIHTGYWESKLYNLNQSIKENKNLDDFFIIIKK